MPEIADQPTVQTLFLKWKQFLDGGALTDATFVASDHPDLVDPLQLQINSYIADLAAEAENTLSEAGSLRLPEPPLMLPDYTVLGPLGEGGMGVVYRVRDRLDREWALKMARHGRQSDLERFLDEARAMHRLDGHPNVVPVGNYGTAPNGRPYFLMPIYPGNLTSRRAEYQGDAGKVARLMAAVAQGVGHLHANGFVHRDLKPHNILLAADGHPVVSDFGLVKSLSDTTSESSGEAAIASGSGETKPSGVKRSWTKAGSAIGTRAYMAPEQAAGLTHLSNPKWDVWAMGVILHELLTGHRPLSSEAPQRLLDPNQPDNPPPVVIKPGLDPKLGRIIQKCLARNEKDRYADGNEVAAALGQLIRPPRRRRTVLLGLAVLATIGILTAILSFGDFGQLSGATVVEETRDPLEKHRERLRAGETVTLIPETGMPTWWRPVHGDHIKPYLDEKSKTFTVDSNRWAFVELFVDPGIDRYRFEFEFRQLQLTNLTTQGGYVGRHSVPSTFPAVQAFLSLSATEYLSHLQDDPHPGVVICRHHFLIVNDDGLDVHQKSQFANVKFPGARHLASRPWRHVSVEVSPVEFTWSFDGREIGKSPARLVGAERFSTVSATSLHPDTPVEFDPRGGLGVFVGPSIASFRNAKIVPHVKD